VETTEKAGLAGVIGEALLVGIVGAGLALAANAVSSNGLSLTRDYFPGTSEAPVTTARSSPPASTGAAANGVSAALLARLKQDGLQLIEVEKVKELFHDPRYAQEMIVFVDARDDEHYARGHIPGARQFDRYHPEKYLAAVATACIPADAVVVYCSGGECEDSEMTAMTLKEASVPAEKLFVYGGGITDWMARHLPIETGPRGSGQIQDAGK